MVMSSRVIEQAIAARSAATVLRRLRRIDKDDLLTAMAAGLRKGVEEILAANRADVDRGRDAGMDEALLDRLALTPERIEGMAVGLEGIARLDDPVGEVVRGWHTPLGVFAERILVGSGVQPGSYCGDALPAARADSRCGAARRGWPRGHR